MGSRAMLGVPGVVLNVGSIPPQVVLAAGTPGVTPRETVLPAIRTVIMPQGEPDGILLRSFVVSRIVAIRIGVAMIVVVNGHYGTFL